MTHFRNCLVIILLLLLPLLAHAQQPVSLTPPTPQPIDEQGLLGYLEQNVAWHHDIAAMDVSTNLPREVTLKNALLQYAGRIVRNSFDYARALAAIIATGPDAQKSELTGKSATKQEILAAADKVDARVSQLQSDLKNIEQQLEKAVRAKRAALQGQRDQISSDLQLAQAQHDLMQNIIKTLNSADNAETGLLGKINNLSQTIPDATQTAAKNGEGDVDLSAFSSVLPFTPKISATVSGNGIIGLSSEIYRLMQSKSDLQVLIAHTDQFRKSTQEQRDAMRIMFRQLLQTNGADNQSQRRETLDNFKKLSNAAVPLSQVNIWMDVCKNTLAEWNKVLDQELAEDVRQLLIRIGFLALAVLIPVFLSIAANKLIHRYVQDLRQQSQWRMLRRIVFFVLIGLVLIFSFFTDFGSLATFAALLTAGVAVALQNVLLSAVAYFLFYGRFGIRVGDTITLSGVTGKVIKIGIVRFYLMELGGLDQVSYPTGRVVSFPNSTLFQAIPLFRALPGTSYVWKEVVLVLDPTSDWELAEQKIKAVVKEVCAPQQQPMQQQQIAMEHITHLPANLSSPQVHLKLVDNGLAIIIRYAVDSAKVQEIYTTLIQQLLKLVQSEPNLKWVNVAMLNAAGPEAEKLPS